MKQTEQACMERSTMLCDLHTHSVFSDGTYTPRELIAEAKRLGLVIALTDHNTVDGLPDFLRAAEGKDIEIVLGNEFSADYNGTLALDINTSNLEHLDDSLWRTWKYAILLLP